MTVNEAFEEIMLYAHWQNWLPDLQLSKDIYAAFPDAYAILAPFAYSFLEEMIRSTTGEYGIKAYDKNWNEIKKRKVGMKIINLAIEENQDQSEYVVLLKEIKRYYYNSQVTDAGDNRHSVAHGYMHPRYWSKESFEKLIFDIARLAKYSRF